jgi:hypothetical protein
MSNNLIIQFRGISREIIDRYGKEEHAKIATVKNHCQLIHMDEPIPVDDLLPGAKFIPLDEPFSVNNSLPMGRSVAPEQPLLTLDILEKRANNRKELDKVSKIRKYNGTIQLANLIFTMILSIITLRFTLQLFGAASDGIVNAIYNMTYLFMAPVFSLQRSMPVYGSAHIEIEAIIAIAFYALISPAISFIINICQKMDFDLV